MLNSEGLTLTRTGTSLGTPLYMSLEQLRAEEDIDHRTDVYAFGVILYEAITGRLPFDATTITEFAIKVATTSPIPVKQLRPDVPSTLAYLEEWAISKNREQRLPNMAALIRELEPFAHEHGFRAEMTNPEASVPLIAASPLAATDSLRATTKYATPATLPFAHERDTSPSNPPAQPFWRARTGLLLTAATVTAIALLVYWLQLANTATTTQRVQTSSSAITAHDAPTAMARPASPMAAAGAPALPEAELPSETAPGEPPPGIAAPPPPSPPPRAIGPKAIKQPQPPQAKTHEHSKPAAAAPKPKPTAATPAPKPKDPEPDLDALGGRL